MDDFERRRELRRQKREEMRLEAERIAYQRNDDDEEEAARERRRRARQERLRQKQEEESLGQVTNQVEANAQNSVPGEETKPTSTHTQVEGDEEAALLERLARREERRQKRLQEALERQKEFDPTITDTSLSLPSRRLQNDMAENDTAEKEEKKENRQERYEIEETEIVMKSYQTNDQRDAEDKKKEKKEEEREEKPKPGNIGENQVEEKRTDTQEGTVVMTLKNGQISAAESKVEEEREIEEERQVEEISHDAKVEEEERERAEAERLSIEAEERERMKAEQDRMLAEEQARIEAEEKAAAEERERREAEERARIEEEERRAAEERQRAKAAEEEKARIEEEKQRKLLEEKKKEMEETKLKGEKVEEKREGKRVNEKKVQEDRQQTAVLMKQEEEKGTKGQAQRQKSQEDKPTLKKEEIKDEKIKKDKEPKEEGKSFLDRKKGFTEVKSQNGELLTHKLKHAENAFSPPGRLGGRASATADSKEAEGAPQVEAGKRLEELRRRRGETESEEFEKLKQKQQEAALELEELKKKREERRKVLEEEEQRRKQEEADRKAREEEEKRRLKEEIERRRAEAAEKRQKMPEDGLSDDKKPFKCFTPKGSSLKIEERAEFLNKSVQKSSGVRSTHQAAVVSKIDSRLEQYTSAIEGTKSAKPTKPAASDLPVPAEGVRNIKSMWEKGNVFSSPSASGTPNKETAGLKVGVSSRINEWLTKTPDGNKSPAPKPSDLRPGDVSGKRNLWEKQSVDKVTSATKV
ncbi:caldesmon isoform X1 [Perognathus longimembris pacificus]|uniref:caldesmon isoform X1 n=1 Tax=Perognathus longimembris pacificus TaxID=214514 RepID=UPI002018645C|nr:caldesmon isoform X1 [Perognathus longimembris pacificus]